MGAISIPLIQQRVPCESMHKTCPQAEMLLEMSRSRTLELQTEVIIRGMSQNDRELRGRELYEQMIESPE